MSDTIKCACSNCGAKYRLPAEAMGRSARCKRCGKTFHIPRREDSLEDTIMAWIGIEEQDDEKMIAPPKVISMPTEEQPDSGPGRKLRGPIRLKASEAEKGKSEEKKERQEAKG